MLFEALNMILMRGFWLIIEIKLSMFLYHHDEHKITSSAFHFTILFS